MRCLIVPTLTLLILGCSAAGDHAPSSAHLNIEQGRASAAFASIGAVVYGGNVVCTAVLVSPTRALAAAHCFDGVPSEVIKQAKLTFGYDLQNAKLTSQLAKVHIHPDYEPSRWPREHDLAVLTLSTAINDVDPMVLHFGAVDTLVERPIVLVGYGAKHIPTDAARRLQAGVLVSECRPGCSSAS